MCNKEYDDEMLLMASQDRPISREELGIKTPKTNDGLQSLNEGFDFLQFNEKNKNVYKGTED